MDVAYLVKIRGRVTGVGFRYSALRQAASWPELRGYIRNVSEDEVEAVVQGSEEQVNAMRAWLRSGPPYARVDECREIRLPLEPNLNGFDIR